MSSKAVKISGTGSGKEQVMPAGMPADAAYSRRGLFGLFSRSAGRDWDGDADTAAVKKKAASETGSFEAVRGRRDVIKTALAAAGLAVLAGLQSACATLVVI